MRKVPNVKLEDCRTDGGPSDGNNGRFLLPPAGDRAGLRLQVSDGGGWDHVSIVPDTNPPRLPTWEEMCAVKALCFRDDEPVVQFHPPASRYVNHHEFCLHLWRSQNVEIPLPPTAMVGPMRKPEGGDGTLILTADLDAYSASILREQAEANGITNEQALNAIMARVLRVMGAKVVRTFPEATGETREASVGQVPQEASP